MSLSADRQLRLPTLLPTAPAREVLRRLSTDYSMTALAGLTGFDRRTLQRIATRPLIRRDAADRFAVALGRHPSEIWADWFGPVRS